MRKKAQEVILECLKKKGMTQSELARRMGEDDVRHLNQQLHRQKDMKVSRFADALESVGFRLEIVDNDGIQRVCSEYAEDIICNRTPIGKFYYYCEDGAYIGIDNGTDEVRTKSFRSYEECRKWLKDNKLYVEGHN